MPSNPDKSSLLHSLRLGPEQREPVGTGSKRRWIIAGVLLLLLAAATASALFLRDAGAAVQVVTAQARTATEGSAAILQATGYITARREATVAAQITGTLTAVMIEEGERVRAGQVLARLDNAAQQAALAQARAQYQAAQALLVQIRSQLMQAQRDLVRNADLEERRLVSTQALETARTLVESLSAQADSQQRQVELAQAGIQAAQVQLDYTTIRAPFDGVIIAKAAQAGEIISPISAGGGFTRTGIGTVVDMDSLEIEVDVNEAYINRVRANQPAQAVLDAYPDWIIPAHVIAIVPTADRSKATVKVRVGIEQKDPRVLPDMGVRVSFLDGAPGPDRVAPAGGVLVPGSAIVDRGGQELVFEIDGQRIHARAVMVGQSYGDLRLVTGIEPGARLVRAPDGRLRDGERVTMAAP
jgi:RND family efflux transporter MFP subunit